MLYIGIDVHKKLCNACIKDRDGNVLGELTFPNNSSGIDKLLDEINNRDATAALESTSNLWLRLYTTLEESGIEVVLVNPKKTRAIAEARLKNDRVDASILADLLRANFLAKCYVPPFKVRELRSLVRHRMNLVKDRTKVKNRIHSLLDKYELNFNATDLFGKAGREWLETIKAELSPIDRFVLDTDIRQIEMLDQLIDETEISIAKESIESEDVKILMTIPGVDFYTALLFVSEVGNIKRFVSSSRLISWLGLAPRVHQSGDTNYNGKISKEGSPRVRWALVQSAHIAIRWDEHFNEKFNRIAKRRGNKKATVAIAREIAVAIYHMLIRREPYRFSTEAFAAKKLKRLERKIKSGDRIVRTEPGRLPS